MHFEAKNSFFKHLDFFFIDIIAMLLSFALANLLWLKDFSHYRRPIYIEILGIILISMIMINLIFNPYSGILRRDNIEEFRKALSYTLNYLLSYIVVTYLLKIGPTFSRMTVFLTYIIFLLLVFFLRLIWKKLIIMGKIPFISPERISLMVVSDRKNISTILGNMEHDQYKRYEIKGVCVDNRKSVGTKILGYDVLCDIDGLYKCVVENNIKEVFFSLQPKEIDDALVQSLISEGIGVQLEIARIFNVEPDSETLDKVGIYHTLGLGLFTFSPSQMAYLLVKRFIDIIASVFVAVFLAAFTLIVKIAFVLCGDNAPIFYKQKRVGKDGQLFTMYKYRSMVNNADELLIELLKDEEKAKEWETYHKLSVDPRITPIGSFLRKTSLDELPQFINVLKGEMSLVGPRPLVEGELKMHGGLKLYERVKPGITGWWACNGRSNISFKERLELEYYYVKNCSFVLDVLTLFRTVYCVIKKTGSR